MITSMKALTLLAGWLLSSLAPPPPSYAVGQVWEYQTRPQDPGSLVCIQRMEMLRDLQVYHISIVGVTLRGSPGQDLPHAPVSRETLDRSLTRPATVSAACPDQSEGIAVWREANGGVFTISLGEIVDVVEQVIARGQASPE